MTNCHIEDFTRSKVSHVCVEPGAGRASLLVEDDDERSRLVCAASPDIVISDIGMPGTDGHELRRRVRGLPAALGGRVPAIALTAFARELDRTEAMTAGFQAHLTKPVLPATLVSAIERALGRASLSPRSLDRVEPALEHASEAKPFRHTFGASRAVRPKLAARAVDGLGVTR